LAVPFQARCEKIFWRNRHLALFVHHGALVVRIGVAKGRNKIVVVGRERPRDDLAEARGEFLGVVPAVAEQILLVARSESDFVGSGTARENRSFVKVVGVGSEGSRRSGIIGVAEKVEIEFAAWVARVGK